MGKYNWCKRCHFWQQEGEICLWLCDEVTKEDQVRKCGGFYKKKTEEKK